MKRVLCSGGFDPLTTGHLDYLLGALEHGSFLIVAVNSDEWLFRKKGYVLMPFEDRKRIVMSIRDVHMVTGVVDHDDTVCEALYRLKPDVFANGGDRTTPNVAEDAACRALGVKQVFNVGGRKTRSSSDLVARMWKRNRQDDDIVKEYMKAK